MQRALECIDGAREFGKNAVTGGVGDAATMPRDEAIRDIPMGVEQAKRADFIDVHQARITRHIGAEYSSETPVDDASNMLIHRRARPFDNRLPKLAGRVEACAFQVVASVEIVASIW